MGRGPEPLPGLSPQWSDNVGRMHLFMRVHPEVKITVPMKNGTDEFIATWPGGSATDRSLGWLMDSLEKRFRDDAERGE